MTYLFIILYVMIVWHLIILVWFCIMTASPIFYKCKIANQVLIYLISSHVDWVDGQVGLLI